MDILEKGLLLLFAVALLGVLSKKISAPLPILQVAGGVLISFIPGFENVTLEPSVFFALFIPPLLFGDSWLIPKRDFARVIRPVVLLAFGLVILTVWVVGYLVHYLIPSIPLAAAFALGAVISPTDAVAVSAVTERLHMPGRITNIINGESLINDASGLVAFKFAVAAVLTGAFSMKTALLSFLALSIGGIAIGLAIGWIVGEVRVWLVHREISEPIIETTLSLLTPFAAYFAAEVFHVSSILAVVASGLYAGIHDTRNLTMETRLQTWEVWSTVLFAFNGLVFVFLGLQLHRVMGGITGQRWHELGAYALLISAVVILIRIAWVFPGAYIPRWLFRSIRTRETAPRPAHVFFVGWAGIRGSVTLAAALSLPLVNGMGEPFPGRPLLIFLASSVIVITMVVNGMTLPLLIRWLNIEGDGILEREEVEARIAVAQAAIQRLQQHTTALSLPHEQAFAAQLIAYYERRIQHLATEEEDHEDIDTQLKIERNLRLNGLSAEREELLRLYNNKSINENVLRNIQKEIDHIEAGLSAFKIDHH